MIKSMASDAQKIETRIKKLLENPCANVGEGSEVARLRSTLPHANIIDPEDKTFQDMQTATSSSYV